MGAKANHTLRAQWQRCKVRMFCGLKTSEWLWKSFTLKASSWQLVVNERLNSFVSLPIISQIWQSEGNSTSTICVKCACEIGNISHFISLGWKEMKWPIYSTEIITGTILDKDIQSLARGQCLSHCFDFTCTLRNSQWTFNLAHTERIH